ncbi:MAG: hypothetical protein V4526_02620 [Patescibacteria group bacterium]
MEAKYTPLDKSWIIRMGILDIAHGYSDIINFLNAQENLGDDLIALKRAALAWDKNEPIDVGESGTLYRFLKFTSWKLNLNKEFVIHRTLKERKITDDPSVVDLPQSELIKLDNNTSQWASAKVLLGDTERLENPSYKLKVTYEAVDHWNNMRAEGKVWEPRYDETIQRQVEAFEKMLKGENVEFVPEQAEDFCFAYTFGYVTLEEGEKKWPSLRGHESDRIDEMEKTLVQAKEGREIISKDHRVIQAIGMWGKLNNIKLNILYPESVNKSWPQFCDFLS